MSISNVMEKEIWNNKSNRSKPVHIDSSIQPHGFLLGVTATNFLIAYCSENCEDHLGYSPQNVLCKHLSDIFDARQALWFKEYCSLLVIDSVLPFVFRKNHMQYHTTVHKNGEVYVLEFEPFPDHNVLQKSLSLQVKKRSSFIETETSLLSACEYMANEVRETTGFDRVMIYRFNNNNCGEVFAESLAPGLAPWLGMHYQETDIEEKKKKQYLSSPMWMIVNANDEPVPILKIDNFGQASSTDDLRPTILWSAPPLHLAHVKHMGSAATFTISLVHNKKLWGLIGCHHPSPKNLPYPLRLAAQVQGHLLLEHIDVRKVADEQKMNETIDQDLKTFLDKLLHDKGFIERENNDLFLGSLHADGAVIVDHGKIYRSGSVPNNDDMHRLLQWLGGRQTKGTYCTSALAEDFPEAIGFKDKAAGIMFCSMGISVEYCIIWFRKETVRTINWAVNPKDKILESNQQITAPKNTFQLWKQQIDLQSLPWHNIEIASAHKIACSLEKHMYLVYLQQQEAKHTMINNKLQAANRELTSLNWHSLHELREPILKLQTLGSNIIKKNPNDSDHVKTMMERMNESAKTMQVMVDDLLGHSKKIGSKELFTLTNLNEVLTGIKINIIEDVILEGHPKINIENMPSINCAVPQMKQLFTHLFDNCIKYRQGDIALVIDVDCKKVSGPDLLSMNNHIKGDYYCISVADNGIGFDMSGNSKILQLLSILNNAEYTGSNTGLAACKRIMDIHKGYIDAEGIEGIGTTIRLYFPFAV